MNYKMFRLTVSMFQNRVARYFKTRLIITVKTEKVNIVSVSLHTAHSLQMTKYHMASGPRPVVFEAKAKARPFREQSQSHIFCHQAALKVEDSPRSPHPWFVCSRVKKVVLSQ